AAQDQRRHQRAQSRAAVERQLARQPAGRQRPGDPVRRRSALPPLLVRDVPAVRERTLPRPAPLAAARSTPCPVPLPNRQRHGAWRLPLRGMSPEERCVVLNAERLTVKAAEAIQAAAQDAQRRGNPAIEDLHLLGALL